MGWPSFSFACGLLSERSKFNFCHSEATAVIRLIFFAEINCMHLSLNLDF